MNIVYFDVETQKEASEVGGWDNIAAMLLAVGVTYRTDTQSFGVYRENEVEALVSELSQADLVVGFNIVRFDFTVLQPYTAVNLLTLPHVDMLRDLYQHLGFRVSLDACAAATLDVRKSADGLQSLRWWREGQVQKVIDYCKQDVDLTRRLYEFGSENGFIYIRDRYSGRRQVPVAWTMA